MYFAIERNGHNGNSAQQGRRFLSIIAMTYLVRIPARPLPPLARPPLYS
jgi:hypothetical protein